MANTMVKIQTVTVGVSGAANIEFASIPQTFTDLYLTLSARGTTSSGSGVNIRPNGVTTNLTRRYLETNVVGTPGAGSTSDGQFLFLNNSSFTMSVFGNSDLYIPNYTSSTTNKSFFGTKVTENNATLCDLGFAAGLWSDTAAITSLTLVPEGTVTFAQYSSATLYGILKA